MTKAEILASAEAYEGWFAQAKQARERGDFEEALRLAVEALPYVDGMMRHNEKVVDAEFESVGAIDFILTYAPAVFAGEALDALDALLKAKKRIDKQASADLGALARAARTRMLDYHRVWSTVEEQGSLLQAHLNDHLGGDQTYWRKLAERLEEVGAVKREFAGGTYYLSLRTNLEEVVEGICPRCEQRHRGVKEKMLEGGECLGCGETVTLVMCVNG